MDQPAPSQEDAALDELLRVVAESFTKTHLDPWTAASLLNDTEVRDLHGQALPGLEHAIWFPIRERSNGGHLWQVVDTAGHVRAELRPPDASSQGKWSYSLAR